MNKDFLGMGTPWPMPDVVAKLVQATQHLLKDHDCDTHGWEEYRTAAAKGGEYVQALERIAAHPAAQVAGDRLETTVAQFVTRAQHLLIEEQEKPNPDNALVGFLCDAVRLAREHSREATAPIGLTCGKTVAEIVRHIDLLLESGDEVASLTPDEWRRIKEAIGTVETESPTSDKPFPYEDILHPLRPPNETPTVETTTGHCIDCIELKNALAAAVKVANEARECHDRDQDMRTMKLLIALSGHLPKWRADTDRIHDVLRRAVERLSAPMRPEEPTGNGGSNTP